MVGRFEFKPLGVSDCSRFSPESYRTGQDRMGIASYRLASNARHGHGKAGQSRAWRGIGRGLLGIASCGWSGMSVSNEEKMGSFERETEPATIVDAIDVDSG